MPLVLPKSVGFVVTPSSTPQLWTVRISSMSAVSRNSFMWGSRAVVGLAGILGRVSHPDVHARLSRIEFGFLIRRRPHEPGALIDANCHCVLGDHAEPHVGEAAGVR